MGSDRFIHVAQYTDHSSRSHKEQISESKNAQTEHETNLSNSTPHSSTHRSIPLDRRITNAKRHADNLVGSYQNVSKNSKITKQRDKGVNTRNAKSSGRYQLETIDEKSDTKPHLWCARCRKKKKCPELGEPTRRFLERIKKRSKESEKLENGMAAGVSSASLGESISHPCTPKKSKSRKQDATVEVVDKNISKKAERERKEKREGRKKKREKEKKVRKEKVIEKKEKEQIPHSVETQFVTRDEDSVEHRATGKQDFRKTCCYLCAENTLMIATVTTKPEQSDKWVQVLAHKSHAETPKLDKSCSPPLLMRTVQSSVKVKTRETSTLCPGVSARRKESTKPRTKHKKFNLFSGLTRTKCPAGRNAACETDKPARRDNAEKRRPKNHKCCGEKNV